jgi:gliding motility-associated-like protein
MKLVQLAALLFINSFASSAQQNWLWSTGSNGNDEALKNTIDKSGNIYTTGYFSLSSQFGSTTLTSSGSGDIFISKQDSSGNYIWTVKAGGPLSDRAYGIAADSAGNIFITGFFLGSATFGSITLNSANSSQDIFIAKLNAAGSFVWAKNFGGDDIDIGQAINADIYGNIIVAGQFRDTAQFDSYTFYSETDPLTNAPSFDIFILKLDGNGNVMWAKQGAAKYDDRGLSVASDASGNIYITGEFSDTLQFVNTYNNNGFNASFILKMDASGNETWFQKLFAVQVLAYSIRCFNNSIYIAGDFQGQLSIYGNSTITLNSPYQYNIFTACLDTSGTVIWTHADGSDNPITALDISADAAGNSYVAGLFKCTFTEYSLLFGKGIFNSAGFRDVFITKYDSTGARIWERQFGGPKDDYCSAVSVLANDEPVISGSFERGFNIPDGGNFLTNVTNYDSSAFGPMQQNGYCNDPHYGKYTSVHSNGNKDIFSAKPFDALRSPFDFFDRAGGNCVRDTLMPYLNNKQDTVVGCDSVLLYVTRRTGDDGIIGPEYEYHWSNNETLDSIYVLTTGLYHLDFNYKDQCRIFSDSIYAIVYNTPAMPIIISSAGTITKAIPEDFCYDKLIVVAPDTAILSVNNISAGYNFYWMTPSGVVNNDTVKAFTEGLYSFIVEAPTGACSNSACVQLYYYDTLSGDCLPSGFVPEIHFIDSTFDATDTVRVCRNDYFEMILVDSTYWQLGVSDSIPAFAEWTISGGYHFEFPNSYHTTFFYHLQKFKADSSGNCSATATVINPVTSQPLISVTRNFYLDVLATPSPVVQFQGPSWFCPGDTVMLTLSGGDNYIVTGPGIVLISAASDTIYTTQPGIFSAVYVVTDAVTGCSDSGSVAFNLIEKPAPDVTMIPGNGIICPGDSVQLIGEPGLSYNWVGPLGNSIAATPSVYATVPGLYHYDFIDSTGCHLISAFVEVKAYTTPFISADPGPVLCESANVTLTVQTNDTLQIQWLPPLSGNATTQIVSAPGIYTCTLTSCGIIVTVSITITPSNLTAVIFPPGPLSVCQGTILTLQANPGMAGYNWSPGGINSPFYNVATAGIYSVEITDLNGCTAIDSITVDTFPRPLPPLAGDVTICAGDSAILSAVGTGIINWYASDGNVNSLATGNSFTAPALFNDTVYYITNSDSVCSSIYIPVHVIINPASQLPPIFGDSLICKGADLNLTTNPLNGVNYSWTGPGGFVSSQQNISIINFDSAHAGYYYLQLSDNSCISPFDSFYVSIYPVHDYNISTNAPLCEGGTLNLFTNSVPGAIYSWTGPNGFSSAIQYPVIQNIQQVNSGIYTLNVSENGCAATPVSFSVNISPVPQAPIITGNSSYCSLDTIKLYCSYTANAGYTWTGPWGFTSSLQNIFLMADTLHAGIYSVTVSLNGCTNSGSYMVSVTPEPDNTMFSHAPICEGDTLLFSAVNTQATSYSWTGPKGFSSSQAVNMIFNATVNNSGYYFLTVNANGCVSSKNSVLLKVYAYPKLNQLQDTIICSGNSATFTATAGYPYYTWNNLASASNTFTTSDSGLVTLLVSAGTGLCRTERTARVSIMDCDHFIPNVFTPDGDGTNDYFYIIYESAKSISVTIYNRWGEELKKLNGHEDKWDGKDRHGNSLPSGTYFYTADVINFFDVYENYNGFFELIRK